MDSEDERSSVKKLYQVLGLMKANPHCVLMAVEVCRENEVLEQPKNAQGIGEDHCAGRLWTCV